MKKLIICIILCSASLGVYAQSQATSAKPIEELRLNLNEDGSRYLKWTFLNQVWLRYNESNPGTTVLGKSASETFDIGLRRTRIQFFGQLNEHVFFYTQFGQNNFNYLSQNAGNRKLQVFFHDALMEYKVGTSDKLKLGAGLTIANGLSRFTQPSVSTIMTLDVPVFAQATVDQTDEFARKLSLYARGQLGKFDYRIVLSDPFPITTNGQAKPVVTKNATFSQVGHHKQFQGFFIYNIFDTEAHTTPYMTGTYLGKKKVFNVEVGFISQNDATQTGVTDGAGVVTDSKFHDLNLWSAALYYDAPLNTEKGTALSLYAGYFGLDYGPGYLRYNGIMNPADGTTSGIAGGHGNSFPMFGTGNVIYTQAGYLLRKNLFGEGKGTLMPYISYMRGDYDRLNKPANIFDIGVNYFIKGGHGSKISLDYQRRSYYKVDGSDLIRDGSKGQLVLQYQISI